MNKDSPPPGHCPARCPSVAAEERLMGENAMFFRVASIGNIVLSNKIQYMILIFT